MRKCYVLLLLLSTCLLSVSGQITQGTQGVISTTNLLNGEQIRVKAGDIVTIRSSGSFRKRSSLFSKLFKLAGLGTATYQSTRIAHGKSVQGNKSSGFLLPLGLGAVISADKIFPRQLAGRQINLRYVLYDKEGKLLQNERMPYKEREVIRNEGVVLQKTMPEDGQLVISVEGKTIPEGLNLVAELERRPVTRNEITIPELREPIRHEKAEVIKTPKGMVRDSAATEITLQETRPMLAFERASEMKETAKREIKQTKGLRTGIGSFHVNDGLKKEVNVADGDGSGDGSGDGTIDSSPDGNDSTQVAYIMIDNPADGSLAYAGYNYPGDYIYPTDGSVWYYNSVGQLIQIEGGYLPEFVFYNQPSTPNTWVNYACLFLGGVALMSNTNVATIDLIGLITDSDAALKSASATFDTMGLISEGADAAVSTIGSLLYSGQLSTEDVKKILKAILGLLLIVLLSDTALWLGAIVGLIMAIWGTADAIDEIFEMQR